MDGLRCPVQLFEQGNAGPKIARRTNAKAARMSGPVPLQQPTSGGEFVAHGPKIKENTPKLML